ncbi:MAG: BON domain-containing protein [Planctomycetota bacterium]|nr:BON domain-containing protein [Planctomycetota bacterium]
MNVRFLWASGLGLALLVLPFDLTPALGQEQPAVPPALSTRVAKADEIGDLLKNYPSVKVLGVGGQVFIDGSVDNAPLRERIEKIVKCFANVVDVTTFTESADANQVLAQEVEKRIGLPEVKVRLIRGNIVLDGDVNSAGEKSTAENVAKIFTEKVVNNIALKRQMVEIDMTFVDVNLQYAMDIRHNPATLLSDPGILFDPATMDFTWDRAVTNITTKTYSSAVTAKTSWLFRLLEDNKDAKVLDRPHMTTLTGEAATFRQGGEKGYELVGLGTADVKFKEFGLIINVTPTILRDGSVQLNFSFEVSTPDPNGPRLDFLKYSTSSVAVLRQGETLIVSGLVQDILRHIKQGVPFLSRIPMLGHFFANHQDEKSKRDLMLVVTPRMPTTFGALGVPTSAEQNARTDAARMRWVEDLKKSEKELLWENHDRKKAGQLLEAPSKAEVIKDPASDE